MTVDVVFSDSSLGGTSRSALTMGRAWGVAGHRVRFRPQTALHPVRMAGFSEVGEVLPLGDDSSLAEVVHLHHAAWSPEHLRRAAELTALAERSSVPPRLLTHNVFGTADRNLESWPGGRSVGVLGAWAAEQYKWSMLGSRGAPDPVVIPNPQDTSHFVRSPPETRAIGRARLAVDPEDRVALRIGSPHPAKWSRDYVEVIRRHPELRFVLVGAPDDLVRSIGRLPHVTALDATSDEGALLELYAAADVFAHIADRGESFGNVLIEAILTGLPVVSLARPYRDNTPWEFRKLAGFHYVTSVRQWESAVVGAPGREDASDVASVEAADRYGIRTVAARLRQLADDGSPPEAPERPGLVDRSKIGILHNPLAAQLKALRLRR